MQVAGRPRAQRPADRLGIAVRPEYEDIRAVAGTTCRTGPTGLPPPAPDSSRQHECWSRVFRPVTLRFTATQPREHLPQPAGIAQICGLLGEPAHVVKTPSYRRTFTACFVIT